jgi:hypothetical protein
MSDYAARAQGQTGSRHGRGDSRPADTLALGDGKMLASGSLDETVKI